MAALSNDRNTIRKGEGRVVADNAKLAANTTCWNGGMVANNGAGALAPAADTAGFVTLGVARQRMVNATGAAAVVSPPASVVAGQSHRLDNAAANGLTISDLGKTCYVVDDHTVGRAAATVNSIAAGTFDSFDPDGSGAVFVKVP